jgi:hypothetical protein
MESPCKTYTIPLCQLKEFKVHFSLPSVRNRPWNCKMSRYARSPRPQISTWNIESL